MGRKRNLALLCTAAALAVMAGCGSSDDNSDADVQRLSPAQFQQQAAAICTDVTRGVERLGGPRGRSVAASEQWAAQRGAIQDDGLEQLARLAPPESADQAFETLRTTLTERRETTEAAQVKVVRRDRSVRAEMAAYQEQQPTLDRATAELRLPSCNWQ